jgi:hypothetical protein
LSQPNRFPGDVHGSPNPIAPGSPLRTEHRDDTGVSFGQSTITALSSVPPVPAQTLRITDDVRASPATTRDDVLRAIAPSPDPPLTLGRALARLAGDQPEEVPPDRLRSESTASPIEPHMAATDPGQLIAGHLAELLQRRRRATAPKSADRRRFPRHDSRCTVSVVPLAGAGGEDAIANAEWRLHAAESRGRLLDLGLPSAAISLREPLDEGTRVLLRLVNRERAVSLDATGRVLRCADLGEGCRIVVALDERLTLEELLHFGHYALPGTCV